MPASSRLAPLGYQWLAEHFKVDPIPHFVESYVVQSGTRLTERAGGRTQEIYPQSALRPVESVFDHLEFALKREGLHLELLRLILPRLPPGELAARILAKPTGINIRRLWYLFERFTGTRLPVPDLKTGNYVDLLDPDFYFTGPVKKYSRWRINRNLLHNVHFSPMVRRTPALDPARDARLHERCAGFIREVPPHVFQRALRYLYAKETRTSYEIEHEKPTQQRAERFMDLLARAASDDFLTQEGLVALQHTIVDPRYAASGWRKIQNYVGRTLAPGEEEIHLVPPRPGDIEFLMQEWLQLARRLSRPARLPPIASAAVCAWLFVYFHPFEDGNGRIHRFLIHHILARRQFGPSGVLLPVSAVLLNRPAEYDASLEVFSKPLKARSDYQVDDRGMTVRNATLEHFRYVDCTPMAEALYSFLEETIEKELPAELGYLQHYDAARTAMREIVDMPEPAANLFLRLCLQNNGRLSKIKRQLPAFEKITDAEVAAMEDAVIVAYGLTETRPPSKKAVRGAASKTPRPAADS
ncbi:MAG: filamentation induced by cAMP protein Fic [Verrucomicrobiaceae bacterium]|nr:filamentation induced by cAMP protein Fic [Verrucomicrobiaceae bacterium]